MCFSLAPSSVLKMARACHYCLLPLGGAPFTSPVARDARSSLLKSRRPGRAGPYLQVRLKVAPEARSPVSPSPERRAEESREAGLAASRRTPGPPPTFSSESRLSGLGGKSNPKFQTRPVFSTPTPQPRQTIVAWSDARERKFLALSQ